MHCGHRLYLNAPISAQIDPSSAHDTGISFSIDRPVTVDPITTTIVEVPNLLETASTFEKVIVFTAHPISQTTISGAAFKNEILVCVCTCMVSIFNQLKRVLQH